MNVEQDAKFDYDISASPQQPQHTKSSKKNE